MDSEQLHEKLSALLDGELADEERQEIEALIASDPAVAREWNVLTRMDRLFREMPQYEAPEELAVRLRTPQRARKVSFGHPRLTRRTPWPLLAAAAALVAILGFVVLQLPQSGSFTMTSLEHAPSADAPDQAPLEKEEPAHGRVLQEPEAPPDVAVEAAGEEVELLLAPAPPPAPPAPAASLRRSGQPPETVEQLNAPQTLRHELPSLESETLDRGSEFSAGTRAKSGAEVPEEKPGADAVGDIPAPSPIVAKTPPAPPRGEAFTAPEKAPTDGAGREEAPAAPASSHPDAPADSDTSSTRHIGNRLFEMRSGVWVQSTYGGQETVALERASEGLRALIAKDPSLEETVTLPEETVFEAEGAWYRIPAVEKPPPPEPSASP